MFRYASSMIMPKIDRMSSTSFGKDMKNFAKTGRNIEIKRELGKAKRKIEDDDENIQ